MSHTKEFTVKVQGIEDLILVIGVADTEDEFKKTTIENLKRMIHAKRPEIETKDMRLIFASKSLEDENTFEDCKLRKGSLLHIVIRMRDVAKAFSVHVMGIERSSSILVIGVADTKDEFEQTTIKRFKEMVHAKRPEIDPDSMRLIYGGKQLEDEKDGRDTTFKNYKLVNNATLSFVFRLKGGSKKRADLELPPLNMEKEHDFDEFSLKFTEKPDSIDPYSSDQDAPKRIEMSCGHATGPNSLTGYCRVKIQEGDCELRCPAIVNEKTNQACNKIWEYTEVRQVALLTDEECVWFESKIAERAALKYCDMKECPGCHSFIEREDLSNLRVHCVICKKKGIASDFCWQCLKPWTGPSTAGVKCDRADCEHPDIPSIRDAPLITIKASSYEFPNRRACPNCGKVVEHNGKGCKNIVCMQCKKEFCFVCLEFNTWGHWVKRCKQVAPKQTTIPLWRR